MVALTKVKVGGRGIQPSYKFDYRIGVGLDFLGWSETDKGKASAKTKFNTFSAERSKMANPSKKTCQFVARCGKIAW